MSIDVEAAAEALADAFRPIHTRDVLRWNFGPDGALDLARVIAGAVLLGLLERAIVRLEQWVDG